MTPFEFGQKIAATPAPVPQSRPLAAVKQPMGQALTAQAKMFPNMVNMARNSGQSSLNALNSFSHAVRTRTGEHPSNWEMVGALMEPGAGFSKVQPSK